MSTERAPETKPRKHKEKSEKKSKKRQREEDQTAESSSAAAQRSPKKKRTVEDAPPTTEVTPAVKPRAQAKRPESDSAFYQQTSSLYVPLASIGQAYPLDALCAEHLSPLLLTYYPPFKGVVLCYKNPRVSEAPLSQTPRPILARSIDEYAVSFVWVTADFIVLRPQKGIWIEGFVNLQNESHLGLVCWNLFSASIDRRRLPEDWAWVEAGAAEGDDVNGNQGHFVDGSGKKIDGVIKFRIRDFETSPSTDADRGFITIEGSLLPEDKEAELDELEQQKLAQRQANRRGKTRARAQGR
ncbi:hypothetical protein BKA81DRAFT_351269 [Phyllosticta paracitricarpa]|uniref:DNA-directed RNA polymerase subunit n=1 Tax=Phyllosticta paracitricarpa TaxID=2016321 RepID=A0ABR1N7W1_9PEZI